MKYNLFIASFLAVFVFSVQIASSDDVFDMRLSLDEQSWGSIGGICTLRDIKPTTTICEIKLRVEKSCRGTNPSAPKLKPAAQQKIQYRYTDYYTQGAPTRSKELKNGKTLGDYDVDGKTEFIIEKSGQTRLTGC